MAGRLEGRVALVMGAGSSGPGWGNGKATAVLMAREGATVVAVDNRAEAAEETAAIIRSEGHRGEAAVCDVTRGAEIARLVEEVTARHGRIDVLHNNVGIAVMGGPVELDEAEWQRVLDVNLKSVFLACKHVIPVMLRQGKGAIVNVSSLAAIRYMYPYASYYASKAAINQMSAGLALQYARHGIRVNVIMPGLVDTPMIYGQISVRYRSKEEMVAARNAVCPTGRMGTAWDVAKAAVFLASDDAAYITGHCLPVDGGLSLQVAPEL